MKYQLIEVRRDINTSRTNKVRTLSAILFMIRAAPLLPGLLWELLWPALITEKPQSLTLANNTGLDLGLTGRPEQHHLPDVTNLSTFLYATRDWYVHCVQWIRSFYTNQYEVDIICWVVINFLIGWDLLLFRTRGPSLKQQLQHGSHRGFIWNTRKKVRIKEEARMRFDPRFGQCANLATPPSNVSELKSEEQQPGTRGGFVGIFTLQTSTLLDNTEHNTESWQEKIFCIPGNTVIALDGILGKYNPVRPLVVCWGLLNLALLMVPNSYLWF